MAELVASGSRTLETGLGVSTALFAMWGADHTCVVASEYEVDQLRSYLEARQVDMSSVTFQLGSSDVVMPRIANDGDLDLVFIDGCHGWPNATIDWYYGANRLREGGVVIIDDTQLRQVSMGLIDYLDADPRWERVKKAPNWCAYRRRSSHAFCEDWRAQPFLGVPARARFGPRVPAPLRPAVKRIAKRLRLI
jgi:predicted O-methyltransferase YrrM